MRVTLLVDEQAIEGDDPQCLAPHGNASDDNHWIAAALRSLGHDVIVLPFVADVAEMTCRLRDAQPDVVFNSTDHVDDDRRRAPHVVALLDLLGLRYTGSGVFALALTTDKARSRQILGHHGVPVPSFFVVEPKHKPPRDLSFPLFVKPLFGGSKDGVSLQSVVSTRHALAERLRFLHRAHGPAICEQYIEGRELTVAVLDDGRSLRVFPVREMIFGDSNGAGPKFATHRVMEDKHYRARWRITMENAVLTPEINARIADAARTSFRALALRTYARLDIRLAADGTPYVIEVNANPALRPAHASFLSPWEGLAHEELIALVLAGALRE